MTVAVIDNANISPPFLLPLQYEGGAVTLNGVRNPLAKNDSFYQVVGVNSIIYSGRMAL